MRGGLLKWVITQSMTASLQLSRAMANQTRTKGSCLSSIAFGRRKHWLKTQYFSHPTRTLVKFITSYFGISGSNIQVSPTILNHPRSGGGTDTICFFVVATVFCLDTILNGMGPGAVPTTRIPSGLPRLQGRTRTFMKISSLYALFQLPALSINNLPFLDVIPQRCTVYHVRHARGGRRTGRSQARVFVRVG